ncbi:unnamed protein product [Phaedon cochleariae]|uniref:DNA 3'-5' helicase n=1 Tax=Phaedon cochleariae TaxID=80249 RepID=A0A9N9SEZ1_PHACE|nr:unnamed protein product [Phaedon cochleariae]
MDESYFDDDPHFGEEWDETVLSQVEEAEAAFMLKDSTIKEKEVDGPSPSLEHLKVSNQKEVNGPSPDHIKVLNQVFGHKQFKPLQWNIISSIIKEKRDCCAVMMTGYGKSLCFQYPSVYTGGITIILSPLISLMQDQVLSMKIANVPACLLGTANKEQNKTIEEIFNNKYLLVYCTPEFCTGHYGRSILVECHKKLSITLIAIDEAHCVSSWGHDFRQKYRQLGILRDLMPEVPILAVTATATEKVRQDIVDSLKLRNPQVLCSSFDRENFYFEVNRKGLSVCNDLKKVMKRTEDGYRFSGSTIIYCITKKKTEELAMVLTSMGIKCQAYHAGLPLSVRKKVHEGFVEDNLDVVIATVAFGMGIDKPDVRNVIHYGISQSIESYYQEVGRAGRDGLPAKCILFYADTDFSTLRMLAGKSQISEANRIRREQMLKLVEAYLISKECRRKFIISHFEGKEVPVENQSYCCDNCSNKGSREQNDHKIYEGVDENGNYDFTDDAKLLLKLMKSIDHRYGMSTFINMLRGSKRKKLSNHFQNPYFGSGKDKSEIWWKEIGKLLTKHEFITTKVIPQPSSFMSTTVEVTRKGEKFLTNPSSCMKDTPSPLITPFLKIKGDVWISSKSQTRSASSSASTAGSRNIWISNKCQTSSASSSASTLGSPGTAKVLVPPSENDEGKKEVLKLYKALLNKRLELAQKENCLPYMIASNKAILDMAEKKPKSLEEVEKFQFDGMNAVKITKYGGEFLKVILSSRPSMEQVLSLHPLPGLPKLNDSITISYHLYRSGKSLEEIAENRNLTAATITRHLVDCMKYGYNVELSRLGVNKEIAHLILDALKTVETGLSLLKPIKLACPEEVEYGHLHAMQSYLRVREHLDALNLPYKDFEDVDYYQMYKPGKFMKNQKEDSIPVESNCLTQEQKKEDVEYGCINEEDKDVIFVESDIEEKEDTILVDSDCSTQRHEQEDLKERNLTQFIKCLKELEDMDPEALNKHCFDRLDDADVQDREPKHKRHKPSYSPVKSEINYSVLDSPERQSTLEDNHNRPSQEPVCDSTEVSVKKEEKESDVKDSMDGANFRLNGRQVNVESSIKKEVMQTSVSGSENNQQKKINLPPWLTTKKT